MGDWDGAGTAVALAAAAAAGILAAVVYFFVADQSLREKQERLADT